METRANYAIVGFFTIVVVLMAFGFVYWMSVYGREGKMERLIVRIPGSANGLSVGSPVRFNGIPIGTIRALDFDRKAPAYSLAVTEIRTDAPVFPGTRAVLEIQGFTGAAYLEFSGGDPKQEPILVTAQKEGKIATIDAMQSGVTNIVATASKIADKTDQLLVTLQSFVNDNRQPLTDTVGNVDTFTKALKDNAPGIDKFLQSVTELSGTIKNVSGRLDTTLAAAEKLIQAVDPKKIDDILVNARKVSADLADASGKVGGVVDEVHGVVADAKTTIKKVNDAVDTYKTFGDRATASLDKVDKLVAAIDPQKIQATVDDVHAAVANAGKTVKDLDEAIATYKTFGEKANVSLDKVDKLIAAIDPDKVKGSVSDIHAAIADARTTIANIKGLSDDIGKRRVDIDKTITDVTQLMANLNKSSGKVDGVIDKASSVIAAINPNEISAAVSDARAAIGNFKGISQDVDKHRADIDKTITNISEMSANLNKASTRVDGVLAKVDSFLGSGDSKSLFADARATLKSYKDLADNINGRIGPIAENIARFSGSGLQNVNALVEDARRAVQTLNQAISRLDNNPQRLLFGGQEVKEYNGRTRH